ncbi:ABC-type sugar transport system, permease component [Arthrobacter sp. PAMC 25486]|uniref:carbohydrate ABC transporter permease n=1 Tax=Arthrobacter sp. PAMC 25486 TaxID=1494608 RepID=UPI000535CB4F|nr:carbohydrate ABC transporter permease [Arthrobacter sp. PAMC 25486]AIY02688.1 ABC-type sugar transport system, permease component [Arthrobacter sp. PAMC 25486]
MKIQRKLRLGRWTSVIVCGLIMALPLMYLLSGSLMSFQDIVQYPPRLLPSVPQWANFSAAFEYLTFRTVANTFIFVIGVLTIQLAICLPAGFALSKIPFRWTAIMLGLFIVPMFMPTNLILIPTYVVTLKLGLVGSFWGLILPVAGQASLGVLLFRQFFAGLPQGLIEAARIDGANWFQTFSRIALPLAKPIIASYSVVTFLTAWNLYIWPLVAAPGPETRVLTLALAPLAGSQFSSISPAIGFAAAVIAMVPVLIVFIVFQKWFTKGVAGSGLE